MSNRTKSVISGLLTVIFWVCFGWTELGGIVHAFKDHSVGDGFAATIVPPWAWYRSIEFFWHKDVRASRNASQSGPPEQRYPPLIAREQNVISRVFSKAQEQPLTE